MFPQVEWANVSDDVTREPEPPASPDVVSLAASWYARAQERAASAGASPELVSDVAELGELTVRIEALAAEPDPAPEPDGSDIARRYERGAELLDLNARVADIMTRVAEEPEAVALWRRIADDQRESAASAREAARIIGSAGPA
jgi:hypothetical protein